MTSVNFIKQLNKQVEKVKEDNVDYKEYIHIIFGRIQKWLKYTNPMLPMNHFYTIKQYYNINEWMNINSINHYISGPIMIMIKYDTFEYSKLTNNVFL